MAKRRRFTARYKLRVLQEPVAAENEQLRKENARLRRRLEQAQMVLEIQKKASEILGIPLNPPPSDDDA